MRLSQYFTEPYTEYALERYVSAVPSNWSVAHKLELYRSAQIAFESSSSDVVKQNAFNRIYESLRSGWQVFRPISSDECWGADQIFNVLTNECQACSRQSSLTLATLTERESHASIEQCLRSLGKMKPTKRYPAVYPWMAVAKFLHFFNPRLFAIYDTAFIWDKVANGAFKRDYTEFCHRRGFHAREDTSRFNLQYVLWSAETIQEADTACMTTFSDWFSSHATGNAETTSGLSSIGGYYASAFEMIAIGAAHL